MHAGATACVGIGLRAPHFRSLAERRPALGFLEVHSENFFGAGGEALAWLERFRADYPLSLHGVGMSLGSADPLDEAHLRRLEALVRRFEPMLVSEHLSWSSIDARHANELLPLPRTRECAAHVAARIARVQDRLRRRVLVENVSAYVELGAPEMPEGEFVAEVARRAGCGVLLDVNNVWVNAANFGLDPAACLAAIPAEAVAEYHLGGFEPVPGALVDSHGAPVCAAVWSLYEAALARIGPRPTLIERDTSLPPLDALLAEAWHARALMAREAAGERAA